MTKRIAFPAAVALLMSSSAAFAGSLGAAGPFNAVIFGDLDTAGGDTEGSLAVGGNMSVDTSYSVGSCSSANCETYIPAPSSLPQSNGTRDDLVVAGDLTNDGATQVQWGQLAGNVQVGGSIDADVDISTIPLSANSVNQNVGDVTSIFDFATAQAALLDASSQLAGYAATGAITSDFAWNLTLTGTNADLNVFNLTAEQWNSTTYGKERVIDVPDGARVLINVAGTTLDALTGQFKFAGATCQAPNPCPEGVQKSARVLVNYYEATSLTMNQFLHDGAVLAPTAHLTATGGAINGQAVLESAEQIGGHEFHTRLNNGISFDDLLMTPPALVPVPAGLPLAASALAGLVALRRMRKPA